MDEILENKYIKKLFPKGQPSNEACSLRYLMKDNIWFKYFKKKCEDEKTWIDFESEISTVVQSIDLLIKCRNNKQNGEAENKICEENIKSKIEGFGDGIKDKENIYNVKKLDQDLNKLIAALEIYISQFIENTPINFFNPSIEKIHPDRVLSFNYSNTYERVYEANKNNIEYCYIHGKARKTNKLLEVEKLKKMPEEWFEQYIEDNNMVLGIDEYLSKERANKEVEFISFKKYYQRIYKKTGNEYKKWIEELEQKKDKENIVYIFGHSLDVTDGDILRELIGHELTQTIIFYRDKIQLGTQIANLVKVLGSDNVIKNVYSAHPKIKFVQQSGRTKIKNSYFEFGKDIIKWSESYKMCDSVMKKMIDKLTKNIKRCNLQYFGSQEKVITLFDVLQKQGLSKWFYSDLFEIAKKIANENETEQPTQFDNTEWDYVDYYGYTKCDDYTQEFIKKINAYNATVCSTRARNESEAEHVLQKIQDAIDNRKQVDEELYRKSLKEIFGMFQKTRDIEKLWSMLCSFSTICATDISEAILKDEIKKTENLLDVIHYKHLLEKIYEEKYMEELIMNFEN